MVRGLFPAARTSWCKSGQRHRRRLLLVGLFPLRSRKMSRAAYAVLLRTAWEIRWPRSLERIRDLVVLRPIWRSPAIAFLGTAGGAAGSSIGMANNGVNASARSTNREPVCADA